jgi:hypothetical protein
MKTIFAIIRRLRAMRVPNESLLRLNPRLLFQ